jgi:type IV pilus assembly protein PilX
MKPQFIISPPRQQRGAVLIVSLLMLLIITILALGAGQSTRLQERMVSTQRDYDLALQTAEAGLRAGERRIGANSVMSAPLACLALNDSVCWVYELGTLNRTVNYEDQAFQPDDWWAANALRYDASASNLISGDGLSRADPEYYIEEVEEVPDSLSIPPTGPPPSRIYYRIVARGKGGSQNAQAVLHSTYVRRFN